MKSLRTPTNASSTGRSAATNGAFALIVMRRTMLDAPHALVAR
jgi:hypothetical protein